MLMNRISSYVSQIGLPLCGMVRALERSNARPIMFAVCSAKCVVGGKRDKIIFIWNSMFCWKQLVSFIPATGIHAAFITIHLGFFSKSIHTRLMLNAARFFPQQLVCISHYCGVNFCTEQIRVNCLTWCPWWLWMFLRVFQINRAMDEFALVSMFAWVAASCVSRPHNIHSQLWHRGDNERASIVQMQFTAYLFQFHENAIESIKFRHIVMWTLDCGFSSIYCLNDTMRTHRYANISTASQISAVNEFLAHNTLRTITSWSCGAKMLSDLFKCCL